MWFRSQPLAAIPVFFVLFGCSNQPDRPRVSSQRAVSPIVGAKTSLPDYAQPRGRVLDPSDYDGSDVIHYRALTRSDFKGVAPPEHMLPYRDRLGATTCAYIVTSSETRVLVQPVRASSGKVLYEAVPKNLGFRAQMDRSCSWWNPEQKSLETGYVLEHEQIHFALFELEARRLDAEAGRLTPLLKTVDTSIQGARQAVQSRLEGLLAQSLERVLERSREFDEATSMGYRPEKQKVWLQRVESELARTELAF